MKDFEKELEKLLKKYNCSIVAVNKEVRILFWDTNGNIKHKIKSFKLN